MSMLKASSLLILIAILLAYSQSFEKNFTKESCFGTLTTVMLDESIKNIGTQGLLIAHGGGLNKCGCHFNRKTGECHCHRNKGCGCECQPSSCS